MRLPWLRYDRSHSSVRERHHTLIRADAGRESLFDRPSRGSEPLDCSRVCFAAEAGVELRRHPLRTRTARPRATLIPLARLALRSVSMIETTAELRLVALHGPGL